MDVCSPSPKGEGDAWLVSYCCFWFLLEARDFSHVRLHKGLPEYLQKDLDAYKKGKETDCSYMDCLWCELYGSINVAFVDGEITKYHAEYLREKFLGIDPR